MTKLLLLGACFLLLNSYQSWASESNPMICQPLPQSVHGEKLCLLMTVNRGDLWFVVNEKWKSYRLLESLSVFGVPGFSFDKFLISPAGSYLAVSYAEEGHLAIAIYDLPLLLQSTGQVEALTGFSGNPGEAGLHKWQKDDVVILRSHFDLESESYEDSQHEGEYFYAFKLPEGKLRRVSVK